MVHATTKTTSSQARHVCWCTMDSLKKEEQPPLPLPTCCSNPHEMSKAVTPTIISNVPIAHGGIASSCSCACCCCTGPLPPALLTLLLDIWSLLVLALLEGGMWRPEEL
eukprot:1065396-Pelagomonas_calceolata.AAC.4